MGARKGPAGPRPGLPGRKRRFHGRLVSCRGPPSSPGPVISPWPTGRGHGVAPPPLQAGALAPPTLQQKHARPTRAPHCPAVPRTGLGLQGQHGRHCEPPTTPGHRSSHLGGPAARSDDCPPRSSLVNLAPSLQAPACSRWSARLALQGAGLRADTRKQTVARRPRPRPRASGCGWRRPPRPQPSSLLGKRNQSQSGRTAPCSALTGPHGHVPGGRAPLGAGPRPGTTAREARSGVRAPAAEHRQDSAS